MSKPYTVYLDMMTSYTIDLKPVVDLTDDQFFQLCRSNPDLKFERNANGDIMIMPPTGGDTGSSNAELGADFVIWNRRKKLGIVFDSSTAFKFPNGADRAPDVSWVRLDRWNALTPEQQKKFPPLAPDFVLELRSETDSTPVLRSKMFEYMENGVRLGWLIDRKHRNVEIYRLTDHQIGSPAEILIQPTHLSGEDVLPEFELDLDVVW
jgi:Uma2 family endonuclease